MNPALVDHPLVFEPRLPRPEECSLGYILKTRAGADPDGVFAIFEDGAAWTNREGFEACHALARKLAALGVGAGDMVVNWLPNGRDHTRVLFACSMLGAVEVPLNVAYRGGLLAHALGLCGARVMIAHADLVERLDVIEAGSLETVITPGASKAAAKSVRVLSEAEAPSVGADLSVALNQPWDLAAIIFTSGTTGPSKGVRTTYAQQWTTGKAMYPFVTEGDRMLVHFPLFHIAALSSLFSAITAGGSIAVTEPVKPAEFWAAVNRLQVTCVCALGGPVAKMLCAAPESPDDAANPLRVVGFTHVDDTIRRFATRFGVEVMARYSMSETSCVLTTGLNPSKTRTVGRVRKGLEVRIVDANDVEVPTGEIGELIVRADLPWVLNAGYLGNPQATADAWRNGWFHTGDLLRRDADGDHFYVGRRKDAIRRRGENISAYEVEAELLKHPSVAEVAVIGVGRPDDQEVLATIVPQGAEPDPVALLDFLRPYLAHFMLPRYLRFVTELPKTPNNKIRKTVLEEQGLTDDCWDREKAGVVVRRTKLL